MDSGSQSCAGRRLMSRQTHDLRAQIFLHQRNPMGLCDPHRGIAIAKLNVAEATAATVQPAVVPPIWNEAQIWHAFGFVLVLSAFLSQGGASGLRVGQPRGAGGPVSPFQPTDPAQRELSIQSERPRLAAGTESLRESVASFSGPRSSHLDSSPHQNSCCAFHIWLRFSRFSSPHRSFRPGPELLKAKRAGVSADATSIFDVFRYLCTATPCAAAR
jgi:hypothetical protein